MAKAPIVLLYKAKKRVKTLNELHTKWKWFAAQQYYRREFIELFEQHKIPKFKTFALEIRYNTGHDCDNLSAVAKFFVDTFRELKYVKNDTKAFYKYLKIEADKTLPKQTLQFTLIHQDGD